MSIISEFKEIFSDLPEGKRLPAALEALEESVLSGVIVAVRDPDGEIRYIHHEHYNGEIVVPIAEMRASHQRLLYGDSLS